MKRLLPFILMLLLAGCENPFAPRLASEQAAPTSFISKQTTIDGVFQNFVYSFSSQGADKNHGRPFDKIEAVFDEFFILVERLPVREVFQ